MEEPQTLEDVPQFTFKKRNIKSTFRKRPTTPPPADDSDSDSDSTSSGDDEGRQVKRRKKSAGLTVSSTGNAITASQTEAAENTLPHSVGWQKNDATKASDWYDEDEKAGTAQKNTVASKPDRSSEQDGTYKGVANYQSFIQKNPDRASKVVGPQKTSSNVRTITVTDYAPDVCKDYKQTGFCGFGDSCKFLHARECVKQGWEQDRDWEVATKGKKLRGTTVASANRTAQAADDDDEEAMLEKIPFACIICKKPYTNPIVTRCGHYFCEACALKRYRKDPSCAACGSGTGGVFNTAKKLSRLLERKRETARLRREKARENGEDISEDEEASPS